MAKEKKTVIEVPEKRMRWRAKLGFENYVQEEAKKIAKRLISRREIEKWVKEFIEKRSWSTFYPFQRVVGDVIEKIIKEEFEIKVKIKERRKRKTL